MAEKPQQAATDSVKLGDGTVMQFARLREVDENTWAEMKNYLERNPEITKGLANFSKNPEAMRGWLQAQAFAEHYQTKLEANDAAVREALDGLESNAEVGHIFEKIKTNGLKAAVEYWDNEDMLRKINSCMGGVPAELAATLRRVEETPLSLHEAAKNGDVKAITEYLRKGHAVDGQDAKGITPLCYAAGSGRTAAATLLVESGANIHAVDLSGNTALHYAAGYGFEELVEYLLSRQADPGRTNSRGDTPHAVALVNRQWECDKVLAAYRAPA
uniref:Uncharacterized protein n=1 Tax=Pyrodinium bahamense TaxID=73915 RepID=A0A7S0AW07_9DINO